MTSLDPAAERLDDGTWHTLNGSGHHDPHALLGARTEVDAAGRKTTTIRARRPGAATVTAVFADGTHLEMVHLEDDIWQAVHPGPPRVHRIVTTDSSSR